MATPTKKQLQDLYNQSQALRQSAQGTQYAPQVVALQKNINDYISQYVPRKGATPNVPASSQAPQPQAPQQDPITSFNQELYKMLQSYQSGNADITTKLYEQQQGLQTEQNARGMAYNPDLGQLSPAQQSAIRQGSMSALEPQIQNTNAQIKASDARMQNFTAMIQQAREFGKDYAEQIVPDKTTIEAYKQAIIGGQDLSTVLKGLNKNTIDAVMKSMTSEDWSSVTASSANEAKNWKNIPGGLKNVITGETTYGYTKITDPTTGETYITSSGPGGGNTQSSSIYGSGTMSSGAINSNGTVSPVVSPFGESNISPTLLDTTFRYALSRIGSNPTKQGFQREYNAARTVAEKKQLIWNAIQEGMSTSMQDSIDAGLRSKELANELKQKLIDYKNSGGNTNIFAGTAEDIARKLGTSTDQRLVEINNLAKLALFPFRKTQTGVQFSEKESQDYFSLFPNKSNTFDTNMTLINSIISATDREMAVRMSNVITRDAYNQLFGSNYLSSGGQQSGTQSQQGQSTQGQRKPLSNFEQ